VSAVPHDSRQIFNSQKKTPEMIGELREQGISMLDDGLVVIPELPASSSSLSSSPPPLVVSAGTLSAAAVASATGGGSASVIGGGYVSSSAGSSIMAERDESMSVVSGAGDSDDEEQFRDARTEPQLRAPPGGALVAPPGSPYLMSLQSRTAPLGVVSASTAAVTAKRAGPPAAAGGRGGAREPLSGTAILLEIRQALAKMQQTLDVHGAALARCGMDESCACVLC
jgi:hypothetical protein